MHSASNSLFRAFCLVMALLLLFPAMVLAAPDVPGDVTQVTITAPTAAAPAFVKAGGSFPATYSTDGTGSGMVRYWLGGTISLGQESVTLPVAKTINLTVPAGTPDGPWDLSIDAKNIGQDNWITGASVTSVIVDSIAPVVEDDALIQPNGGEYLHVGDAYDIKWDPAKIVEANLAGIDLELWVAGAFHSKIATGLGNTGTFAWTVPAMVTQQAKVMLIATDKAGLMAADESDGFFTIYNIDATPPLVNVTAPADDTYVTTNSIPIAATASDPESGIVKVVFEYSKDGGATWVAIVTDVAAPYEAVLNVTALPDGTKLIIKATAWNGAGASAFDTNGNILIDRSKPTVAITAPTVGQLLPNCFTWKADAADPNSGVASVQFFSSVNGSTWTPDVILTAAPYEKNVCEPTGFHWVKAVATNKASLMAESVPVKYEVDATAPTIKATTLIQPNGGEALQIGNVYAIMWNKADITDLHLAATPITLFLVQGGVETQIDGAMANTGAFNWTVSGIPSADSWIKIVATDTLGNKSSDMSDKAFTIYAVDKTPPTAAVTSPAANAWVTGAFLVKAAAADAESGILQVAFFADHGAWGANPDMAAPYEETLDTTGYNGALKLWVVAKNGVGMETTSAVVTVNVDNTPPTVALQQPAAGNLISGTAYEFVADASDAGSGVAKVVFEAQANCQGPWALLGTVMAAPYKLAFDTTTLADGAYCFHAVATDKVGLATTTADVRADVKNTYTIALKAGWNLISTPLVPYNTDIATAMSGVAVKQVATFIWSSGKLVQQTWIPGVGGTLKTFKDGQGYWVEAKVNGNLVVKGRYLSAPPNVLPSYAESVGWNLIGYTARFNMAAQPVASYLGPAVNAAAQANYKWNTAGFYELAPTFDSGMGYWLALSQAGTIFP